jgi:hypothetical protein
MGKQVKELRVARSKAEIVRTVVGCIQLCISITILLLLLL